MKREVRAQRRKKHSLVLASVSASASTGFWLLTARDVNMVSKESASWQVEDETEAEFRMN